MFSSDSTAAYNLKLQARCLAWVPVDEDLESDKQHLLVGTTCLREENEVHLLEYSQSENTLTAKKVFNHAGEIWSLVPCKEDSELVATCYNTGTAFRSTIWRIPGLTALAEAGAGSGGDSDGSTGEGGAEDASASGAAGGAGAGAGAGGGASAVDDLTMEELATFPDQDSPPCNVTWNPNSKKTVVSVHEHSLHKFSLKSGTLKEEGSIVLGSSGEKARKAAWDPLHPKEMAVAVGVGIKGIDLRAMKENVSIPHAHDHCVRDVDYNPNKPRFIATSGDDCTTKFWDLRKASEPVKMLSGHSHWVWRVAYNRFHDQLVLSSSSDTLVSLWRVSSISSAPLLELDDGAAEKSVADALAKQYEEHEDSVYGLDWSYSSAWVFASLSFSGRVAVSHVPSPEMYKILL